MYYKTENGKQYFPRNKSDKIIPRKETRCFP